MKIVTILGARPQFIKASVVSHALARANVATEVVIHTGQHFDREMSDVFFDELGMAAPAYNLGIHGGPHGAMTGRMLSEIERVLLEERPDAALVYGDANSTLAGALAAAKLHVPVAHVEAGLRSFNLAMPEEVNRIVTDRLSRWLFAPTTLAARHLACEGVPADQVVTVGDVMYDAALHHGARVGPTGGAMARLGLTAGGYVLATVHREENADNPERLAVIVEALAATAARLPVVWPVHPRTRLALQRMGRLAGLAAHLTLVAPVSYLDMVQLEKHAALVATDSGGVQKEAFFYHVPCVTLRQETEWVELVEAGWNRLAPPVDVRSVVRIIQDALGSTGTPIRPYGDGTAAAQIVKHLTRTA